MACGSGSPSAPPPSPNANTSGFAASRRCVATASNSTHPPTHLRRHLITAGSPQTAAVVVDARRSAAIATELAPPRATVARAVLSGATV